MKNRKITHCFSASLFLLFSLMIILLTSCSTSETYEEKSINVEDDFATVIIDVDTEDIVLLPSDDGKCRVVCYAVEGIEHTVRVDGDKLKVESEDTRSLVERIFSIVENNNKITVYLPTLVNTSVLIDCDTGDIELPGDFTFDSIDISLDTGNVICNASAENSIKIESDTGDIKINNSKAKSVTLESDTGDTVLSGIVCHSFVFTGDTGNITLSSVIAEGEMTIEINTGDVIFNRCDASEVKITTNTGDVKGSFLTDKIIFVDTDTGRTDYPKLTAGGRCDITTDTGDIKISIGE